MIHVRTLGPEDISAIGAFCRKNPVNNVFIAARIAELSAHPAHVWGFERDDCLTALCYVGGNIVPTSGDEEAPAAFAGELIRRRTRCASLLGPAEAVNGMWSHLQQHWNARVVRPYQPLLATSAIPEAPTDPYVRLATTTDIPALWPAAIEMHREEVGLSPLIGDGGASFRARLEEFVRKNLVYVRYTDNELIFKAEIGSVAHDVCQVQGVWVRPDWRGRGFGTAAMAAVTTDALRRVAPTVSLYVNDFNLPALAVYERCGFARVGTFATVSL